MNASPRLIAWPRLHRFEHQAVSRTCPAMPSSAEITYSAVTPAWPPPERCTSSGRVRYSWYDSAYEAIIAAAKETNARSPNACRHSRSTGGLSPAGTRRGGRYRPCSTVRIAKIAAADRHTAANPALSRTMPMTGPSRMPPW